jgi:hypothetical protein
MRMYQILYEEQKNFDSSQTHFEGSGFGILSRVLVFESYLRDFRRRRGDGSIGRQIFQNI